MDKKYVLNRLAEIVGLEYVTDEKFVLLTYTQDFGIQPPLWPAFVVRPGMTEQVAEILKLANELKIPVSPRGGGSAQEGGCQSDSGIVLETLRMDKILDIDEDTGTVTVEAGITFVKLMDTLEKKGWKIGIAPSGAIAGTLGAHIARPGVGWGNIKYVTQGDQVIGLKVVLPMGNVVNTGSAGNLNSDSFFRYCLGPDLAGLFIGSEGTFGVITEATLRMYPWPEKIYLERYVGSNLHDAINIFREIALRNLVCYISVPVIKPDMILFDVNVEGDAEEVDHHLERIRSIVRKYPNIRFAGPEGPQKFWERRWFNTGEEFKDGIAGAVNYFLPFAKLEEATYVMREIMEGHGIKKYAQQMFPGPTGSEHVSLMFHHPGDKEEYAKIQKALGEMMDKALAMGGSPYSKGQQWAPYLEKHLSNTGYWRTLQAIKKALDPNHIMNPGVVGL
ncbi:MAG: FAD-binding oxidoreductase [Chloroflexi bacterium]|nr:FAD-binding oxidoreductase [Chloroflexota bacterium]